MPENCERCEGTGEDPQDFYCNSCGEETNDPAQECCHDGEIWPMPCRECQIR